jgi:hypothetical protein
MINILFIIYGITIFSVLFYYFLKSCAKELKVPISPRYKYTIPCHHCVVGNAERIAQNGNLSLYECPKCGGLTNSETRQSDMIWFIGWHF